ncbi:YceI family protein [Pedobacter sp.]|jgi:polyisoprenoid-binding protein YceI|uniref:YceI family protein n=1 Tax=Pedobacter sp. TaxID=1411316 RepID=UPI002D15FD0E|nr:YceI family protein [Pedobacter sp.]HWW41335.1 YceI family protein [Pedobacter sp.]
MKTIYFILLISFAGLSAKAQSIAVSKNASISFFSSTVVEDIEGKSNTANSALDLKTGNIIFKVMNTSFQFKKKLMQEHFNENYMESNTYPFSEFKGKIIDPVDFNKDGNYTLSVEGTLNIHGVTKTCQSKVNLVIDKGIISAKSVFRIKIADYKIKVPSIVFKNVAESVEVRVSAVYQPKTI